MKRTTFLFACIVCVSLLVAPSQALIHEIYDDGGVHDISTTMNILETFNSSTGDPTTVNIIEGALIQDNTRIYDDCIINISAGEVHSLETGNQSQATISGGTVTHGENAPISTSGSSHVLITGGNIITDQFEGRVYLFGNSQIEILGTAFILDLFDGSGEDPSDPQPTGPGLINAPFGLLTGTLQNGDPLSMYFRIENDASILIVPEPATMLLLGLGGLALRRRRK